MLPCDVKHGDNEKLVPPTGTYPPRKVYRSDVPAQTSSSLFLSLKTSSSLAHTTSDLLHQPVCRYCVLLPLITLCTRPPPHIVPLFTRLPASGGPQSYSVVHSRRLYLFGEPKSIRGFSENS